jgi:hypothetical protein
MEGGEMATTDYQDIEDKELEVQQMKADWLRSHGWEDSSSNPACCWLWSKGAEFKCVSQDMAIRIERAFED